MNKKMVGWNALVSVVFVLLLIVHMVMLKNMHEWYIKYETFWPAIDGLIVRPLLAFTTGYALFSALFSLLKAKIEIAGLRRWNLLRVVMSALTLAAVAVVLLVIVMFFLGLEMHSRSFYSLCLVLLNAELFWLALGLYWFLSLNALRVPELEPLDDDDFDDDDFDED